MVTFASKDDRYFNDRTQPPLLLGSVNAHTTMKVSQNGEAFFFVNDFTGNPVADMEVSVNVNDYSSHTTTYENGIRKIVPNPNLDVPVYSKSIVLGKTNKD